MIWSRFITSHIYKMWIQHSSSSIKQNKFCIVIGFMPMVKMDVMWQDALQCYKGVLYFFDNRIKLWPCCCFIVTFSYDQFHQQQKNIVSEYPDMVDDELTGYDEAVCKFFSVDRRHPDVSVSFRNNYVDLCFKMKRTDPMCELSQPCILIFYFGSSEKPSFYSIANL